MPRHTGLWYSQWAKCGRCGFTTPIGQMTMQKGLLVDHKCVDNLDVEYRPKIIAEALGDSTEVENERLHISEDPNTIEFVFILMLLPSLFAALHYISYI